MSSSADSAARPLPRLARVWDGKVEPLESGAAGDATCRSSSWRCPEKAAAELAPPLRRRRASGSSTCPGRSAFATSRRAGPLVSGHRVAARGRGVRADRALPATTCSDARLVANPGLLSDRGAARRCCRWRRPGCSTRPRRDRRREVRHLRAPAARRAIARTSRRTTARCRPTACSATGTSPRWSRSSAPR